MRRASRATLAVLLLLAPPVSGEVYRWTDEAGRLHFTQSLEQVPHRHRAAARAAAEAAQAGAGQAPAALQTYEAPSAPEPPSGRTSLQIPFERYGSLMRVEARVNDELDVPLFVDTGASGIALPRAVIERLGIRIGPGTPRAYVGTAAGPMRVPIVRIESVQLGGARVENLEAAVSDAMDVGLLGGSFFNHFVYSVDAARGVITLSPNQGLRGGLRPEQWRERYRAVREPLAELEAYLAEREVTRAGRRAELEGRRAALRAALEALDDEARRASVPASWRAPEASGGAP